jgi:hypothetical protein
LPENSFHPSIRPGARSRRHFNALKHRLLTMRSG